MNIAIIPARGGSKRIPRKNIREFCGKPMIAWSIEAALSSGCFDKVIVSTDDHEIAHIAKKFGAEVPFIRSKELSDDHTVTAAVIKDAVTWFVDRGECVHWACCIYATAPFVRAEMLIDAFDLLKKKNADFVLTVGAFESPIQRAVKITTENRIEMIFPEYLNSRSQDLEPAYHDAGQFYWGTAEAWMQGKRAFTSNTVPYIVEKDRVQDIDTISDWNRAEFLFKMLS